VGFVHAASSSLQLQLQRRAAVPNNCFRSIGLRQCTARRRSRKLSSFSNDDDEFQQLRRRLSKMERIVNQQQESIDSLKATLSQLLEVTDELATVINIQR
jgi:exonuclease VII large subunit